MLNFSRTTLLNHLKFFSSSQQKSLTAAASLKLYEALKDDRQDPSDHLRTELNRVSKKEQLFEIIQRHARIMNSGHLLKSLELFNFKHLVKPLKTEELTGHESFKELTDVILTRMKQMTANDLTTILFYSGRMGLHSDSKLVDAVCQHLRLMLNNLDVNQLVTIYVSLGKLEGSSTSTSALQYALPVVFQTKVKSLKRADKFTVVRSLSFALKNKLDIETYEAVAEVALQQKRKFTADEALMIIYWASREHNKEVLSKVPDLKKVLLHCLDTVACNVSALDDTNMNSLLKSLKILDLYSKDLYNALWFLAPSWDLRKLQSLVSNTLRTGTLTLANGQLVTDLLVNQQEQLKTDHEVHLTIFAQLLGCLKLQNIQNTEYDESFKHAGQLLMGACEKIEILIEKKTLGICSMLLNMAILKIYPTYYLNKVFAIDYQKRILTNPVRMHNPLIMLEQCLRLEFGASCPYSLLPEFNATENWIAYQSGEVTKAIEAFINGKQYVTRDVTTPLGTRADVLLAKRKGEFPVALRDKENPLEDLPRETKVLGILYAMFPYDGKPEFDSQSYWIKFRSHFLSIQNIQPVVIDCSRMKTLSSKEVHEQIHIQLRAAFEEAPLYEPRSVYQI